MRIVIDYERCIASGMCTSLAASLFRLDESGKLALVHGDIVIAGEEESVLDAVECCPVEALALLQGDADKR